MRGRIEKQVVCRFVEPYPPGNYRRIAPPIASSRRFRPRHPRRHPRHRHPRRPRPPRPRPFHRRRRLHVVLPRRRQRQSNPVLHHHPGGGHRHAEVPDAHVDRLRRRARTSARGLPRDALASTSATVASSRGPSPARSLRGHQRLIGSRARRLRGSSRAGQHPEQAVAQPPGDPAEQRAAGPRAAAGPVRRRRRRWLGRDTVSFV